VVAPPAPEEAARHGVHATFFVVRPDHGELAQIAARVDAGSLRPVVAATYPLAEGAAAFASGNGPRPPGKIILIVRT
jgi:NADPH:quinone reductase-like Zn-dependent oxidoreductase